MPRLFFVVVGAAAIGAGVGMSSLWNGHRRGSELSAFHQCGGASPRSASRMALFAKRGKQNMLRGTRSSVNRSNDEGVPQVFLARLDATSQPDA